MKTYLVAAAAAAVVAMANIPTGAGAMPLDVSGIRTGSESIDGVAKTQYFWGGRRYCWYPAGWHGPGWYWCGYGWRRGFGWGGPLGWHGWRHRGYYGGRRGGVYVGPRRGGPGPGFVGRGGAARSFSAPGARSVGGGGGRSFSGGGRGGFGGGGGRGGGGGHRSDVRLKHDIAILGYLDDGLGFYRFKYNGSDRAYVGVMAQEVEVVRPDAVTRDPDGYLRVDYDRLGIPFETFDSWRASGARIPAGTRRLPR